MKPRLCHLALGVCLMSASLAPQAQTLNDAAQRMFNDLGAVGNVTPPQAFAGQTLNTYTGGSMFIRTPTKSYQLAAVNLPYVKAGCGGIDLFGGSFSHISADQFKDMLKNITSALPAVTFDMMLKSVEPLFGSTIEWFKQIESTINRANVNACETATMLASTALGKAGFDSTKACERAAMSLSSLGLDAEGAKDRCRNSGDVASTLGAAAGDPALKDTIPFEGNLVWAALLKLNHLDNADRELIMSITGTTIYERAVDGASEPRPIAPTLRSVSDLLYGNVDGGSAVAPGQVRVKLLRCSGSNCTTVTESNEVMPSLTTRVRTIMYSLSDKIATRSGAPSTAEINFVNWVPTPVYRLLSSSNAINNPAIASSKIEQYAQYVAIEFAYALLARFARMGLDTVQFTASLNDKQIAQLNVHRANAAAMLETLNSERAVGEQRQQSMMLIAEDIDRLDRTLRASMPQQLADLLGYAKASTFSAF